MFDFLITLNVKIIINTNMYTHALILFQRHCKDVSNFDPQFTSVSVNLTPTDKVVISNISEDIFDGFSYLNPEFVQHI